jgi:hypothetical protein
MGSPSRRQKHRLLQATSAISVVKQGSGRAVTGVDRIRRLFAVIVQSDLNHHDVNALAMILSRRVEAPEALTREIVDDLAPRLGKELLHLKVEQHFEQKFRSTIQSIAGLFRWRLRESRALLAEDEPVAQELRDTLLAVGKMLRERRFAHVPALAKKQDIVLKLIEYLDGGGDPDILRQI